jgi:hypothetical protein
MLVGPDIDFSFIILCVESIVAWPYSFLQQAQYSCKPVIRLSFFPHNIVRMSIVTATCVTDYLQLIIENGLREDGFLSVWRPCFLPACLDCSNLPLPSACFIHAAPALPIYPAVGEWGIALGGPPSSHYNSKWLRHLRACLPLLTPLSMLLMDNSLRESMWILPFSLPCSWTWSRAS